ncbi:MAG TPA: DUF3352 domain-containing protein [Candidatus Limnocylindrales bacterium]|nr:DUF3352 domain-containing protein [Candidatus Limnocylindrales bacterium]
MKRFAFLLLALALLLAVLPAAAQSTPDLTALAQYFPGQTPVYASLRTDDAYIATLEALRTRIAASLPAEAMGETTIPTALDGSVRDMLQMDDATFASAVRPWLGDTAAFGVLNLDSMMEQQNNAPYLVALSVTDRAAAEAFFAPLAARARDMVTVETTDAYTLYSIANNGNGPMALYIDNQVLLVTNKLEALPTNGPLTSPLSEQEQFQRAIASLPAETYNIGVYADYGAFMSAALAEASAMNTSDAAMIAMIEPYFEAFGGTAVGFTLLDDRALTMDLAVGWDPTALPEAMGDMSAMGPFDPAFALHLPAGTQLAIQGSNLSQSIQQGLDSVAALQAMESASGSSNSAPSGQEVLAGINFLVRGATGLDLQDDVLSWMTGQYAVGMSIDFEAVMSAAFGGDVPPDVLSFSIVIENTDNQGAEALVSGISQALANYVTPEITNDVTVADETIGGAPAVILTDVASGFQLAAGGNDAVFALGTPDMVRAALAPDGGLNGDAAYQESLTWAVANAPVYLYASGDFFNSAINLSMFGMQVQQEVADLAPLFSSSSISENYDDTAIIARFVLTLAE